MSLQYPRPAKDMVDHILKTSMGINIARNVLCSEVLALREELEDALEDAEALAAALRHEKTLRVGLELMLRELGTQLKDTEELTR